MKTLKELLEERDKLFEQYEEIVLPALEDGAEPLSDEQETRRTELKETMDKLEVRISELEDIEARKAKFSEARKLVGTAEVEAVDVKVVNEPKTYGPDSDNSYFADFIRSQSPIWSGHKEALARLDRYEYEVSVEIARGTQDGKRAERLVTETRRTESGSGVESRHLIEQLKERGNAGSLNGVEQRAMSAGASSGGSFVTPVYFVSEYAPYRVAGRAFIDQCNKQPLPDYGRREVLCAA